MATVTQYFETDFPGIFSVDYPITLKSSKQGHQNESAATIRQRFLLTLKPDTNSFLFIFLKKWKYLNLFITWQV